VKSGPLHYGWVIAASGILVLFSCIGLARFGFTVLIPGMQAGLDLSYQQLGCIGTTNFIGYLLAVFFAPTLIKRFQPRCMIVFGLTVIGISMSAVAGCRGFYGVCLFYTLTGLGTGLANIPMMTLTTAWFDKKRRGKAAGLVICGNGLGIIFVGYAIPLCHQLFGTEGWRRSWLLLGLISLAIAVSAGFLLRNKPAEMGLCPVGQDEAMPETTAGHRGHSSAEGRGFLLLLSSLYLIFGATFMIYGTFIVTTMINDYGFSEETAGLYWSWVGFFSFFSGISFGTLSDKIGRRYGLTAVFTIQTASYLLVGLQLGQIPLIASIILYGLAVFAAPAIVTAAIGDHFSPDRVARAFANATVFFALGQTIGPSLAGFIGGEAESFTVAYLVAAGLTAMAAIGALKLPAHSRR